MYACMYVYTRDQTLYIYTPAANLQAKFALNAFGLFPSLDYLRPALCGSA